MTSSPRAQPRPEAPAPAGRLAVPSKAALYVLFAAVIGLPMVTNFFRLSTSISLGTVLAAGVLVCLQRLHAPNARFTRGATTAALIVAVVVTLHLGLAASRPAFDLARGLGSVPMLAICVMGAASAADLLSRAQPAQLRHVVHRCAQVLLFLGVWGGLGLPEPSFGGWNKPIFPFTEPSHLAITLGPFIIFACVTSRIGVRLTYLGALLVVTALLQSTTLAAIALVTVLLCMRLRYAVITLAVAAPIVASLDLTYYLTRLDFSEDASNLSTLVYLQGWQLIGESWDASHGLGIGFQQLGVGGSDVAAAQLIATTLNDPDAFLNLFDGGFNLAKILSEFGIFGGALLVAFVPVWLRSIARLHRHATRIEAQGTFALLACAFIVSYVFELLLRGNGYFTPTGLMALAGVWAWRRLPRAAHILSMRPKHGRSHSTTTP